MQTQANKAGTIHGTTSAVAAILPSGGGGATPPSPRLLYYYHPDYLGNVEYITDAGGLPYQYFFYSPWGENLKEENPTQREKEYKMSSPRCRPNPFGWLMLKN